MIRAFSVSYVAVGYMLLSSESKKDVLTKVFISADSSLVTTANLRKAAPISGSWSLLSALPPSLSRDRERYISLSTWAVKRKTTRQVSLPRQSLHPEGRTGQWECHRVYKSGSHRLIGQERAILKPYLILKFVSCERNSNVGTCFTRV